MIGFCIQLTIGTFTFFLFLINYCAWRIADFISEDLRFSHCLFNTVKQILQSQWHNYLLVSLGDWVMGGCQTHTKWLFFIYLLMALTSNKNSPELLLRIWRLWHLWITPAQSTWELKMWWANHCPWVSIS